MAMLFLSKKGSALIGTSGELPLTFDLNDQEVYRTCGVTFQNKQFIFGGASRRDQILQVVDCGLVRIGSTPFYHELSACGSTDDAIMLCFNGDPNADESEYKRCRQAVSPSGPWSELELSTFTHKGASIAISPGKITVSTA